MNYKKTLYACYLSYIVQGIINNINPILFVNYHRYLGFTIEKTGILIAVNFGVQILVDISSSKFIDRIGYRRSMMLANFTAAAGLFGIGMFPIIFKDAYLGLIIATIFGAIGSGLLEVLVSPIVESLPTKNKDKQMSFLHSFYCWGCVGFVALSTVLLRMIGSSKWNYMPMMWLVIPLVTAILFIDAPIRGYIEKEDRIPFKKLASMKSFWMVCLLMLCAGASEMGMSQWSSYFAETGLKVDKTVGDLLGPCMFSLLMGLSRFLYGRSGEKVRLIRVMSISLVLCVFSYVLTVVAPHPLLGLLGCGISGLSVGVLWPGTYSIASKLCGSGGTAMFGMVAFAGDIGCLSGSEVVSIISGLMPKYGIKAGLLAAVCFPLTGLFVLAVRKKRIKGLGKELNSYNV